ncbi:MAG: RDD family protein [Acidimicrobiales bacterium]
MSSLPPPGTPGPPPGWGQWPPAPKYDQIGGNSWQLHANDHLGHAGGERAGFGVRLGGHLLDQLLYGLLMLLFAVPAVVLGIGAFDDCYVRQTDDQLYCPPGSVKGGMLASAIVLGVIGVVVVAVLYIRALGRTGQTWGRKIVGIKVVSLRDGQPLGVGRALGRSVFAWLISGQLCSLGYLWMLWDRNQQTWHDKVVDSTVVRV